MRIFSILIALFFCPLADAALCPEQSINLEKPIQTPSDNNTISVSAYSLDGDLENQVHFSGDVHFAYGNKTLKAKDASYNKKTGDIKLNGEILIEDAFTTISADRASLNQQNNEVSIAKAHYALNQGHAQGEAQSINSLDGKSIVLQQATYTTCPPSSVRPWLIESQSIKLNQEKGWGSATHIQLNLAGVPILYWPYMTFPLDDRRKSGLLFPEIGSSSDNGFEYSQPIYWNMTAQTDATLTPRYLEERGTQINSELRHLNTLGEWQVDGAFLRDRQFDDDRWLASGIHKGEYGNYWRSDINVRKVSDQSYFDDLDSNLGLGRPQFLHSYGEFTFANAYWESVIGADRYQNLDTTIIDTETPHNREPFIRSYGEYRYQRLQLNLDTEWVSFAHENNVQGNRLDFYPSLAFELSRHAGWFITPKIGFRSTTYQLEQLNLGTTTDESPERHTSIASIDTGLFFERQTRTGLLHTFEPRLYGLYVESEDQSQIPLFDTDAYTFSFDNLFRENQFSGRDRQSDAQQVSLALSSALIDPNSSREMIRLGIGQTFFFEDREVSLLENETSLSTEQTREESDIATQLIVRPSEHWNFRHEGQYEPSNNELQRTLNAMQFISPNKGVLNLGHYYQRDSDQANGLSQNDISQYDLSGAWQVSERWKLLGRWLWDEESRESLETFGGFEYQSCCWGISMIARRQRENNDFDNEFFVQFHFKGLASVGSANNALLSQSINDYQTYQ